MEVTDRTFVIKEGVVTAYRGTADLLRIVRVSGRVREIGTGVFSGCFNLHSAVISEGCLRIGESAFENCRVLSEVKFPQQLESIGDRAFRGDGWLQDARLKRGLERIGREAFAGCTNLQDVTLPEGLKSIGDGAFQNCRRLRTAVLPEGLTELGAGVFQGCWDLRYLYIPASLQEIPSDLFLHRSTALRVEVSPDNPVLAVSGGAICSRETGRELFRGSTPDDMLDSPDVSAALSGRGQGTITIPAGMDDISPALLEQWSEELKVSIAPGSSRLQKVGPLIVRRRDRCVIFCDRGTEGKVVIPEEVQGIGPCAFRDCIGISQVVLPSALQYIGTAAFENCSGLTEVKLPEGLQVLDTNTFRCCIRLQSVTFGGSLLEIRTGALAYTAVESLTFPAGLRHVWTCALTGTPLHSLTLRGDSGILLEDSLRNRPLETVRVLGREFPVPLQRMMPSGDNFALQAELISPQETVPELRGAWVRGFAALYASGAPVSEEYRDRGVRVIAARKSAFWDDRNCLKVMVKEGLLLPDECLSLLEKADEQEDEELVTMLLQYMMRFGDILLPDRDAVRGGSSGAEEEEADPA